MAKRARYESGGSEVNVCVVVWLSSIIHLKFPRPSMLLFLLSSIAHILLSPYSKVEESFNLHAIHDILAYGTNTSNVLVHDHLLSSSNNLNSLITSPFQVLSLAPLSEA